MSNNDSQDKDKNDAPSADEIIEALAQEMGVEQSAEGGDDAESASAKTAAPAGEPETVDEVVEPLDDAATEPAEEEAPAQEPEAAPAAASSGNSNMAGLGGIFDVPSSGGAPEKKAPAAKAAPKKSSGGAGDAGVGGIFDVGGGGGGGGGSVSAPETDYDPLVDDDDDDIAIGGSGKTVKILIGVIVLLVLGMAGGGLVLTGKTDDVLAVMQGTYRDKIDAERRRIEEDYKKKQLAALTKYGELNISGAPDGALVRMQFDGEAAPRIVYAPFAPDSPYTEIRLPTLFKNLQVENPLSVMVAAPGYRQNQLTVTKDKWSQRGLRDYVYATTMYLEAKTGMQDELTDRMEPHDEDFYGTIIVESNPPGAFVKLNGRQVFVDGKPARTPVTIKELPELTRAHVDAVSAKARSKKQLCDKGGGAVCEEATGLIEKAKKMQEQLDKKSKKKSEPKLVKVNTPPDIGHKVELWFEDSSMPKYVTAVNRRLWNCKLKSQKEIDRLKPEDRAIQRCESYVYRIAAKDQAAPGEPRPVSVADFEAIKKDIQRRKAIELEMAQQAAEQERLKKEAAEAFKKAGVE